jgi:TonB family protein
LITERPGSGRGQTVPPGAHPVSRAHRPIEKFRLKSAEKPIESFASVSDAPGKPFASSTGETSVHVDPRNDAYSVREIALAAGVPDEQVLAMVGRRAYVPYPEALRVCCAVRRDRAAVPHAVDPLFSIFSASGARAMTARAPLVLSSTLHLGMIAVGVLIATFATAPAATTLGAVERPDAMRLVFFASPGPGGGGGGGGRLEKAPPPKALREGHHALSSPVPVRVPPPPIEPVAVPPEPKPPPLDSEPLPMVVAPIVSAPADSRNRIGILMQTKDDADSHGPGRGNGAGTGTGTGIGSGDGAGIGPGSGGGTGGGPYRGGSGITPPRLLREVKADYTEEARQRRIAGDVILEIVVRRDGTVGDVKVLQGLGSGLNDQAMQAVRQWRFAPAQRQGTPVDVIVEVAVEFKIR